MLTEKIILISSWIIAIASFFLFIPKDKYRQAQLAFLFKQTLTWIAGLLVVQWGLIEYPVRELNIATKTSFTFEFLVYPIICAFFNVYYPENKNIIKKIFYYVSFISAITIFETLLEKNTQLIKYIHWSWYYTWITLLITFFLSRLYFRWFFKIKAKSII